MNTSKPPKLLYSIDHIMWWVVTFYLFHIFEDLGFFDSQKPIQIKYNKLWHSSRSSSNLKSQTTIFCPFSKIKDKNGQRAWRYLSIEAKLITVEKLFMGPYLHKGRVKKVIFITFRGVSEGQLSLFIFFIPVSRIFQKCSKNGLVAKKMVITF